MSRFNVKKFRSHFPLLAQKYNGAEIVYFDNAATTQKPQVVIQKYQEYYQQYNANVHRASHHLSTISTTEFERSRNVVKEFIHAKHLEEIIWSKGTTESINLLSQSLGQLLINEGDEIIVSQSEHHANIVPWQILTQQKKAHLKVIPLTAQGTIDVEALEKLITNKTKIISCAHISNVIGKINPINDIISLCKKHDIVSIIDGAQAIAHEQVDVQELDCDFYLFSAHKIYGPTGVGVLYGKRDLLNKMPPYQGGGEMISKVSFSGTTYNRLPFKFEAGTPNIAGIIAFASAIEFLAQQNMEDIIPYEQHITQYCHQKLNSIVGLKLIYDELPDIPVFSFTIDSYHNHDVASFLDANGIAIRAGHHCAMPLMDHLSLDGCVRVSLSAYNTTKEVDYLINTLKKMLLENTNILNNVDEYIDTETNNELSEQLVVTFSNLKGWDSRHREIMMMGKRHPRLSDDLKIDDNLVQGCESKAWLSYQVINDKYEFFADSDAKVIRGLLSIVLAAFNHKTKQEIKAFNVKDYFKRLGLIQHLSPSRANGLNAIVERIMNVVS